MPHDLPDRPFKKRQQLIIIGFRVNKTGMPVSRALDKQKCRILSRSRRDILALPRRNRLISCTVNEQECSVRPVNP